MNTKFEVLWLLDFSAVNVSTNLKRKPIILGNLYRLNMMFSLYGTKNRHKISTSCFIRFISANESECSMKACQCDTQLVYKMSNIFETKSDIFDFTKTYKSGYNPYTQCRKARTTSDKKADKCCGEETNRYPFYSMRGQKACCKNRTYDTAMFTCCEDGSLVSLGRRCFRNPFSK